MLNARLMSWVVALLVLFASPVALAEIKYNLHIAPFDGKEAGQCIPKNHNRLGPLEVAMPLPLGMRVETSEKTTSINIALSGLRLSLRCDPTGRDPAIPCQGTPTGNVKNRKEWVEVKLFGRTIFTVQVFLTGWFDYRGANLLVKVGDMGGTNRDNLRKEPCWLKYSVSGVIPPPRREWLSSN